nr:gelsolin-like protein 2 [Lytechinus pictus]
MVPENYEPRLFRVKMGDNKKLTCTQISRKRGNLDSSDAFILDCGLRIYQFNGASCRRDEAFKATQECHKIKISRESKCRIDILNEDEISDSHRFYRFLKKGKSKEKTPDFQVERKMFRVSNADGSVEEIADGLGISKYLLTTDDVHPDVYVINTGEHCYCWVGKGASIVERKNGLSYASVSY